MEELISAISTAPGVGGVAIIRISGEGALNLLEKIFTPIGKTKVKDFEPYKMYCGEIDGESFKDFGMAVFFKGPKSYTGEDMVELHSHGGLAITQGILKQTFNLGAKPATRGEYTKRAFINGKMSLDSCEGLINMINSESTASIKASYNLYRERLNNLILDYQDKLTFSMAKIDANIDYPEEDIENVALDDVTNILKEVSGGLEDLINKYKVTKRITSGVKVAIVGKPNTGKSSLLNRLLNFDKAIVSSIPGTTRDIVEGSLEINGVKFDFYDTAGIRTTSDEIEKIGVERSEKILKTADIVVFVVDFTYNEEDKTLEKIVEKYNTIKLFNKCDEKVNEYSLNRLLVSARTGENIEKLKNELYNLSFLDGIDLNSDFLTEERHAIVLKEASDYINEALKNINLVPLDLIAEDIKKVWDKLGEITGKTASEEIISEIFAKFCVGK